MASQCVRRAQRQNAQRRGALRKPLQHAVDGAIASARDHHGGLRRNRAGELLCGIDGWRSGEHSQPHSMLLKELLNRRKLALEQRGPASGGIDNQHGDAAGRGHGREKPTRGVGFWRSRAREASRDSRRTRRSYGGPWRGGG
jgi:hypothetical protein